MTGIATWLRMLIGDRQSILRLAQTRGMIGIGALWVLSAALAREYDGTDLGHEPWHLAIPFLASVGSSFLLFWLAAVSLFPWRGLSQGWGGDYVRFLRLYWATAPLAWLYAIPVERFLSAPDSVRANLLLLAVVALWRVLLMIRVLHVLTACHVLPITFVVLLFGDALMLAALYWSPIPIVSFMGGVHLTEAEQLVQGASLTLGFFGIVSLPVWLIAVAIVTFLPKRTAVRWDSAAAIPPPARGLWALAVASVVAGLAILPVTQPPLVRATQAERYLAAGQLEQGLAYLSQLEPHDLPPYWDPPPREAYGQQVPDLRDVFAVMRRQPVAPWVRSSYLEKLGRHRDDFGWMQEFHSGDEAEVNRWLELFESLGEFPQLIQSHPDLQYALAGIRSELPATKDRVDALIGPEAGEEN